MGVRSQSRTSRRRGRMEKVLLLDEDLESRLWAPAQLLRYQ